MPIAKPDEKHVEVMVEIPRGSRNKYEYDDARRVFVLDRVLYSVVQYPADYGFIPGTLSPDGDHLDALVVVDEPTFPGCIVRARPIGVLRMRDEHHEDDKVLTVPLGDPPVDAITDISALPPHWLREIEIFFDIYKSLEHASTKVIGWHDAMAAWHTIEEARRRYASKQKAA